MKKKAGTKQRKDGSPLPLPPGIAESNLDNQVSWLMEQMKALANILELPADSTLKDLVSHATKQMNAAKIDRAARGQFAEPIWDSRNQDWE